MDYYAIATPEIIASLTHERGWLPGTVVDGCLYATTTSGLVVPCSEFITIFSSDDENVLNYDFGYAPPVAVSSMAEMLAWHGKYNGCLFAEPTCGEEVITFFAESLRDIEKSLSKEVEYRAKGYIALPKPIAESGPHIQINGRYYMTPADFDQTRTDLIRILTPGYFPGLDADAASRIDADLVSTTTFHPPIEEAEGLIKDPNQYTILDCHTTDLVLGTRVLVSPGRVEEDVGYITSVGSRPNTYLITMENGTRVEKLAAEFSVLYIPPVCRRADINARTRAEVMIGDANRLIEHMVADPRLSLAQHYLSMAEKAVADYFDDVRPE